VGINLKSFRLMGWYVDRGATLKSRLARGPDDLGGKLLKAGPEVFPNASNVLSGVRGCGIDLSAESPNFLLELPAGVLNLGTGAFRLHPNLVCRP
jgi:hypothetical protein